MAKPQPSFFQRALRNITPNFLKRNAIGDNLGSLFRRRGSTLSTQELGSIVMEDTDNYIGMLFAAIRNRATKITQLATDSVITLKKGEAEPSEEPHPYLKLIDESPTFTNSFLYSALSTFLDLKGTAYLLAVRSYTRPDEEDENMGVNETGQTIYGEVQEFKLVNPFNISRVVGKNNGEVGGFVETRNGMYRTIPPEQMIVIHTLNPFDLSDGYAVVDAAKDDQFTLRQAGSTTRHALKNNVGQRGLVQTDVLLEDEEFENFKSAVEESSGTTNAGKFIYGNGPGSISYTDMQMDVDKLALEAITNISRENIFAVMGVSKTTLGIEQSGVTRDTARVQRDQFIGDHGIPQLQVIIDALNQDYRNAYPKEYEKNQLTLAIDSPLKADKESELKDAEIVKTKAEGAKLLVTAGYDPTDALEAVGLEDVDHTGVIPTGTTNEPPEPNMKKNAVSVKLRPAILSLQTSLKNDVVNLERKLLQAALKKIEQNSFKLNQLTADEEAQLISKTEKNKREKELQAILLGFALLAVPLFASQTSKQRTKEFGLPATFSVNKDVRAVLTERAAKGAASHVDTVLHAIYRSAYEGSAEGLSRSEIISKLTSDFQDISRTRAETIARTETNRSVAEAQYQADTQFLKENGLEKQAYKQWVIRSSNPCEFCEEMAAQDPVPFGDPFLAEGDSVTASVTNGDKTEQKSFVANYEDIEAGTLHPNCSCEYELIIEDA